MTADELYSSVKQVSADYLQGVISRAFAAQQLVDALHRVDAAAKSGEFAKSEKNRHFVLLLQHLTVLMHRQTTDSLRSRFSRLSLYLTSQPILVMTGLDFSGLSLPSFEMRNAMLIACNFDGADLRGARIVSCQLQGCSFRRSDVSGADFRRSSLYGCGFEDANTRNAKGLAV
jgi:uncharacterized protein YjbI with pentapeptide repeats